MIIIVSSSGREAATLAAICEQHHWPTQACTSILDLSKLMGKAQPRTVIMRQRLADGYSDDVFCMFKSQGLSFLSRFIVLMPAANSPHEEARQVTLGADCVLRDPLRLEVLLAYLARYRVHPKSLGKPPANTDAAYRIAGVKIYPNRHQLHKDGRTVTVAPQVIGLLRLLSHHSGKVLPYEVIYSDLFNRRFTGDTANARVLFAKAVAAFAQISINLRPAIKVIAKSGYLYSPPGKRKQD